MKRLAALLFLLVLGPAVSAESVDSIQFCDDPFPPYTRLSADGEIEGPSISFLETLFERLQIPLSIKTYPWRRVLLNLESGSCDGVNFVHSSEDRERYSLYSIPIHDGPEQCVWSVANTEKFPNAKVLNFEWNSFDDFSTVGSDGQQSFHTVGRVRGYIYADEFIKAAEEGTIKTYTVSHPDIEIQMLTTGRLALITSNREAFAGRLKSLAARTGIKATLADFHCSAKRWATPAYYLVISKKSPWLKKRGNLMAEINGAIAAIREEGEHTVQAYLLKEAAATEAPK